MKQLFFSLMMICAFSLAAFAGSTDEKKFSVHPNPVERNAILTIETPLGEHSEITVFLFNAVGKVISEIKTSNRTVELNAPDVSGAYFLRIVEKQKVIAVEKIIVK